MPPPVDSLTILDMPSPLSPNNALSFRINDRSEGSISLPSPPPSTTRSGRFGRDRLRQSLVDDALQLVGGQTVSNCRTERFRLDERSERRSISTPTTSFDSLQSSTTPGETSSDSTMLESSRRRYRASASFPRAASHPYSPTDASSTRSTFSPRTLRMSSSE